MHHMPKKKSPTRKIAKNSRKVATPRADNGLEGALFSQGMPGFPGVFGTQNVQQVGNIFNNLRWRFISNMYPQLSELYCEMGLVQTVVNVPVDDALRGGVDITSKELTQEQIDLLQDVIEREGDIENVGQAHKWTRLFGGGGLIIFTDQDPQFPLDKSLITPETPLEFTPVDMWQLYFDKQNADSDPLDEFDTEFYSYYGQKIHKSRVMKMVGLKAPSFLRPRLRGWGLSVVEALVRSINQYLEGTALIYELIGESKVDVYGIKNLTNTLLAQGGTERVAKRIQLANQSKDYQNAIVMDAEDRYEQKQLTFSGLAEVMNQVRMQVASDLRMPITKIFGISAAGFNSGEDDIEVYNAMVESAIRAYAKREILQIIELRCQKLFGFIPKDLGIGFKPLRVMSSEQEQKVKTEKFNRLLQALTAGAMSLEQFQLACNKDDLLEIQLDPSELMEGADEIGNVPGGEESEKGADQDAEKEEERDDDLGASPPASKDPAEA
jgi:phage-related protein (TIGR01555 family)